MSLKQRFGRGADLGCVSAIGARKNYFVVCCRLLLWPVGSGKTMKLAIEKKKIQWPWRSAHCDPNTVLLGAWRKREKQRTE